MKKIKIDKQNAQLSFQGTLTRDYSSKGTYGKLLERKYIFCNLSEGIRTSLCINLAYICNGCHFGSIPALHPHMIGCLVCLCGPCCNGAGQINIWKTLSAVKSTQIWGYNIWTRNTAKTEQHTTSLLVFWEEVITLEQTSLQKPLQNCHQQGSFNQVMSVLQHGATWESPVQSSHLL